MSTADDEPDILDWIAALTSCRECKCTACVQTMADVCGHRCEGGDGCVNEAESLKARVCLYRRALSDAADVIRSLRGGDGQVLALLKLGNALREERATIDDLVKNLSMVTGPQRQGRDPNER